MEIGAHVSKTDELAHLTLFEVEAFFGADKTVIRYVAASSMHEALSVLAEEDELMGIRVLGGLFRVAKPAARSEGAPE
jgi:hypothetical protein